MANHMSNASIEADVKIPTCYLNSRFGIAVQGVLAFSAFCVLIVKRWREPKKQRRKVLVWVCDTSKQGIGAMFIHFANVFLPGLSHEKDECTWYFINYLLDTTVGLLVIWMVLKLLHYVAAKKGWVQLKMGEYGSPPEFKTWFYQCMAYLVVMVMEKIVIFSLFQLRFWVKVKKFILKPISDYPKLELVVVILLVPFVMNALMFWVVDNFLMRKTRKFITSSDDVTIQYTNTNKQYYGMSDDELGLRLMENESNDTLINDTPDNDNLHRRLDSSSR